MDIQRLRNLTTGKLHTKMSDIYEDLETITGEKGLMTHMLPRIVKAITPWLHKNVSNPRFWDGKFDITHIGKFDLPTPTEEDRKVFCKLYKAMPNPLLGKETISINTK